MTSAQVQQVIDAVNHAAGAGWTALVRQTAINGWIELAITGFFVLLGLLAIPALVIGIRKSRRAYQYVNELNRKRIEEGGYSYNPYAHDWWYWNFLTIPAGTLIVAAIFVGIFAGTDAIAHIVNPAGYTIENILS